MSSLWQIGGSITALVAMLEAGVDDEWAARALEHGVLLQWESLLSTIGQFKESHPLLQTFSLSFVRLNKKVHPLPANLLEDKELSCLTLRRLRYG